MDLEERLRGRVYVGTERSRVLVTLLFTDLVGSTERLVRLGDRAWYELLALHHRTVREHLDRFAGREIDTSGDGFLATFDGPARAIACGCELRDGLRTLGVEVRVGLHTGEIELRGADIGGIAVHIASRIESVRDGSCRVANPCVSFACGIQQLVAGERAGRSS